MRTACILICFLLFSKPSFAQELLGTEGDWKLYSIMQDGRKICYLAASPSKSKGTYKKRGEPYFLVTHKGPDQDEVSASSGFLYKEQSDVHVTIDSAARFRFFTQEHLSWARDSKQDNAVVTAMERGTGMVVRGTSKRGTYGEDNYTLKGFAKALKQMKAACP